MDVNGKLYPGNQRPHRRRLTNCWIRIKFTPQAEVAELADALGSGLSGRKAVRVQVPPSAQTRVLRGFFV